MKGGYSVHLHAFPARSSLSSSLINIPLSHYHSLWFTKKDLNNAFSMPRYLSFFFPDGVPVCGKRTAYYFPYVLLFPIMWRLKFQYYLVLKVEYTRRKLWITLLFPPYIVSVFLSTIPLSKTEYLQNVEWDINFISFV